MNKLLIIGICTIILSQFVIGIGVAPADPEVFFEPGKEETLSLMIINNEERQMNVNIKVQSDYEVILETSKIFFREGERERSIEVKVKLPEKMDPGPNIAKISVSEEASTGMIAAFVTVVSKLTVFVPYPGKFLKANLVKTGFTPGKKGNFIIELENLGEELVETTNVAISLRDANVAETIEHTIKDIERSDAYYKVPWIANLPPGIYEAEAKVDFAENTKTDFNVGEQKLEIKYIEAKYGEQAEILLTLFNNWNRNLIDAYAEVEFTKDGQNYGSSPTQIIGFKEYEEKEVLAYWNLAGVNPGFYNLKVKLYYLDKVEEFEFNAVLTEDSLVIRGFELITKEKKASPVLFVSLLIIIVIIAVLILYLSNKKDY